MKLKNLLKFAVIGAFCLSSVLSASAYTVKWGDTLRKIAVKNNTTVEHLSVLNKIKNPDVIFEGQELIIPYWENTPDEEMLGVSIPTIIAWYEDSLATRLTETSTSTFTLVTGQDKQERDLNGFYGFVFEEGTTNEEFITANCVATACTIVTRGIDVQLGDTNVSSLQFEHRRGSTVKISNYPQLAILSRIMTGDEDLDNTLTVSSTTFLCSADNEFCSKYYIDTVGAGGFTAQNVSTTYGVQVFGTSPETMGVNASSTRGLLFDTDGKLYVTTTPSGGITSGSGGLSVDVSDSLTWTADQTITGSYTMATTTMTSSTISGSLNVGGQSDFSATTTISELCIGTDSCATSTSGLVDLTTTTIFGKMTDVVTTTAGNWDEVQTVGFQPRYIEINYFVQGHTADGDTAQYLGQKGKAVFNGTSLYSNIRYWNTPNVAGDGLNADNGYPNDTVASYQYTGNDPNSVSAIDIGTNGADNNDINTVLTIPSISSTGFTLRCATSIGAGTNTSNARCKVLWKAFR